MADDIVKGTEPAKDNDDAAKGATFPAPIPAEERPTIADDRKKAADELAGKDPELADLVDDFKESDKLVKVVKDGKTLSVHPDTLEAHLAVGFKIAADEVKLDEKADAPAYVATEQPKPVEPKSGRKAK